MTIRKNFLLDEEVAEHLKKIALESGITQTQAIKDMIEERYQKISIQEKLEAFEQIVGSSPGLFVGKSVQSIKAEMNV